ncbi:MAG: ribonuclease HII [Anaerolineales bacterium]|nr:ribonuclease HII [Anaerolineales bacterium]
MRDSKVETWRPHLRHEQALWVNGALWVAGIDEAGRGALAGPVAAAAVILPQIPDLTRALKGVRDSKLMTPRQRQIWARVVQDQAVSWAIGMASAGEIDALGILPATQLAAERALERLVVRPDHLLLDYLHLPQVPLPQTALVKGDRISLSIAAASVLAKTGRDALLQEYDQQYPGYGFAIHKGYGTASHRAAIAALGPCPIHRLTFAPFVVAA